MSRQGILYEGCAVTMRAGIGLSVSSFIIERTMGRVFEQGVVMEQSPTNSVYILILESLSVVFQLPSLRRVVGRSCKLFCMKGGFV